METKVLALCNKMLNDIGLLLKRDYTYWFYGFKHIFNNIDRFKGANYLGFTFDRYKNVKPPSLRLLSYSNMTKCNNIIDFVKSADSNKALVLNLIYYPIKNNVIVFGNFDPWYSIVKEYQGRGYDESFKEESIRQWHASLNVSLKQDHEIVVQTIDDLSLKNSKPKTLY